MAAGGFIGNVATLAAGNALAQVVSIAAVPVITRLYAPEQFGLYAIFLGVVAMILPI